MKKVLCLLLTLTLSLSLLAGCGDGGNPSQSQSDSAATQSFTDDCGRVAELPVDITRYIPAGPIAQMTLMALAPEKMAALSTAWEEGQLPYLSDHLQGLPLVGALYGKSDLNLEALALAAPQVVIDIGEAKDSIVEDMDAITSTVGIPTIHIEANLENMPQVYRTLGRLLGCEEKAEELAVYCEDVYAQTQRVLESVGEAGKVDMLYCQGDNGLHVIAQGAYHGEMLDLITRNPAVVDSPSAKGTGNEVDMEQLALWNPTVIVFAPDSIYDTVADDPAWQGLDAIAAGRYYRAPGAPYNWLGFPPSVNRYMGMLWLCNLLYPQEAAFDMYEETARYYQLFYGCALTREAYNTLTAGAMA